MVVGTANNGVIATLMTEIMTRMILVCDLIMPQMDGYAWNGFGGAVKLSSTARL